MIEKFEIIYTQVAIDFMSSILYHGIQHVIINKIDKLAESPESKGLALREGLQAFRSLREITGKYRVVYMVNKIDRQVVILAIGVMKKLDRFAQFNPVAGGRL